MVIQTFWTFLFGAGGTYGHSILFNVDGAVLTTQVHTLDGCPPLDVILFIAAGVDPAAKRAGLLPVELHVIGLQFAYDVPPLTLALDGARVVKWRNRRARHTSLTKPPLAS